MTTRSIENIKLYIKQYGSGYYFNIDPNGKVLDCFSIARVEGMSDMLMQVIGTPRFYQIEDIPFFLRDKHKFVHISQVHLLAKFEK